MKRSRDEDEDEDEDEPCVIPSTISRLSIQCLRVELHRRKLSTEGIRLSLEDRLCQHLKSFPISSVVDCHTQNIHLPPSFITVPKSFHLTRKDRNAPALESQPIHSKQLKFSKTRNVPAKHVKFAYGPSPSFKIANIDRIPPLPKDEEPIAPPPLSNSQDNKTENEQELKNQNDDRIPGFLQANSIWVCGEKNMRTLWQKAGPIGKASLSRSAPGYQTPQQDKLKGRAMRQFLTMDTALTTDKSIQLAAEERANTEHLQLSFIEAYYTAYVLNLVKITDPKTSTPASTWRLFSQRGGPTFGPKFVAYARYRASGWLPRSGLKYGVDWVLYPGNTGQRRHTHSPYCIVLRFSDSNSTPAHLDRTWVALQNRLRLVKNVAKTLVVADVSYDHTVCMSSDVRLAFKHVSVTELTIDRWVP